MNGIADYEGALLNHLEANYRPHDRELAIELVTALGFEVVPLKYSRNPELLMACHPNAEDQDPSNNVMFINQMSPVQLALDTVLRQKFTSDPELRDAMNNFQEACRQTPGGTPHFGLRYRSRDVLEKTLSKLRDGLTPELRDRVTVTEVPPYPAMDGMPDIRSAFVQTDVLTASPAGYGQLIELQVERAR